MMNRTSAQHGFACEVFRWALGLASALAFPALALGDQAGDFAKLNDAFQREVRPILAQHCLKCHATDVQEGTLDLEQFATFADVRRSVPTWVKVAEMLDNGEMPPKKAPQPAPERKQRLRTWVADYLRSEALASAGDPGPVVLRRLNNAEYTYTVSDLTHVDLNPAREFPADGAAGEGFTNTGNALVMSPALLSKYMDAAKKIADHAVLVPDGIRFSPGTTRRDFTDELLTKIRGFYAKFTESGGGTQVNLQGIVFGTNEGGRLPVEKYLAASLRERSALRSGTKSVADVAHAHGLNPKYLQSLWSALNGTDHSAVLDRLRAEWSAASPEQTAAVASSIGRWQRSLWRFTSVGQIGKVGGPKAWMEPVTPIVSRTELRLKIPPTESGDVTISLDSGAGGDGNEHDLVVWDRPRLVAPGRPDLLLRDVRSVTSELAGVRERAFGSVVRCLRAAAVAGAATTPVELGALAQKHDVEPAILEAWLDYLGIGTSASAVKIGAPLTVKVLKASGYDFANGWSNGELPQLIANASDQHVRIPGNLAPHSIAVHPSPTLRVAVGWLSPIRGVIRASGRVQHAHPECGNGVTWTLETRRGAVRRRLAAGVAAGPAEVKFGPITDLPIQPGDLVSLAIGPRDGNHSCDLTAVDLTLSADGHEWNLAREVSPDVLAGSPHPDSQGHPGVWNFYTEADNGASAEPVIPPGSLLARWQLAKSDADKEALAKTLEALLKAGAPAAKDSPDAQLFAQISSLRGPLLSAVRLTGNGAAARSPNAPHSLAKVGLDAAMFGKRPDGSPIDGASLCARAPHAIEVHLPADLAAGCEFVSGVTLDTQAGPEASVQARMVGAHAGPIEGIDPDLPLIAAEGSAARRRFEQAFDAVRQLFPPSLCYTKIVPVDEVITLTLFYREDDHLKRLMLEPAQVALIDRLWAELRFVSQDALTLVDAFAQLMEYATQDADPSVFAPMRQPINDRAAAFRRALAAAEPYHINAVVAFADRAFRRPLKTNEEHELRALYRTLRDEKIPHDEAIRLLLARVLVSPAFLYRLETPPSGDKPAPVSDSELASRLSYFLWSSMPDDELRTKAIAGELNKTDVLVAQARRMVKDPRVRRLANEFACQWLHIYDFESLDEKSHRHFPTFAALKSAMREEAVLYFTDLFQNDGSVRSIFDADHTFVNEALAKHYGIPGVSGDAFRKVDGVRKYGRGGILGLSATLAKQSGASRTSPILRGNWVAEVLLGDKLPRPPKNVPQLPDDEAATQGLTMRQLVEKHTSDARCASCHSRIDAFGFALEAYDAIGRRRDRDLGDRPIDTSARLRDGTELAGIDGLRSYLTVTRRDAVVRQFCRKFLGYALGRGIQLSDDPLLASMEQALKKHDDRMSALLETVVTSRQFREIRGRDAGGS